MPSFQITAAFAAIVALIVASPGPNLFLLLRNTSTLGRRVGLLNTLGACAAILSHALLEPPGRERGHHGLGHPVQHRQARRGPPT